jgi:hypothetical protein
MWVLVNRSEFGMTKLLYTSFVGLCALQLGDPFERMYIFHFQNEI